jgi:ketosteroid isomerase-like protein
VGGSQAELVRHAYDAWNWYGLDHLEPYLAAHVELHDAPELPDARTWRGSAEVLKRLEEVAETTGGGWVELRGVEERGDGVLVTMTWKLDSAEGGSTLGEVSHLVEVADERITRIRVFVDG